uniref:Uncharacterized protein n=1 Tax=Cacopsylla melanoneura TaxID=428564 RepID=A0A8D8Z0S2_9HEMI
MMCLHLTLSLVFFVPRLFIVDHIFCQRSRDFTLFCLFLVIFHIILHYSPLIFTIFNLLLFLLQFNVSSILYVLFIHVLVSLSYILSWLSIIFIPVHWTVIRISLSQWSSCLSTIVIIVNMSVGRSIIIIIDRISSSMYYRVHFIRIIIIVPHTSSWKAGPVSYTKLLHFPPVTWRYISYTKL